MRHPGAGAFNRESVPRPLRGVTPSLCLHSVHEVDLEGLANEGRKLVLLDVDNTLLPWKASDPDDLTQAWIKRGQALGLRFCAVSNTRHPERLTRICGSLGISMVRGKFKPSPNMYLQAMEEFGCTPEETVMLGDQLLTDVLGANRAGIDAIWVQRLTKKEFVGTFLVSRNVERLLGMVLRRWFQADEEAQRPGFFQRSVVRQLIKFAVVGGTATVVDLGLSYWLMKHARVDGVLVSERVAQWVGSFLNTSSLSVTDVAWLPLKIGPVLLAILVSYALNFAWTFRSEGASPTVKQAAKFTIVALIGMVIGLTASTIVKLLLHGSFERDFALASLAQIAAGFVWNFNAQRIWTFRAHRKP